MRSETILSRRDRACGQAGLLCRSRGIRALRKGGEGSPPAPGGALPSPVDADVDGGGARIRCPLCAWVPRAHDRWVCSCGCVWNTFDTRGRCPDCGHQWMETQCHACNEMSAHASWYVEAPTGPAA